jgi:16S rRNA (guanine966-N2)-methyltransferase
MRITGGRAKGRRLTAFKGLDIRPTSDLVREAIFDLIGQDWQDAEVLDLYAGTGSLGIEALSRGASRAVFIDLSRKALDIANKNLEICGFRDSGFTVKADLSRGLPKKPFLEKRRVDLVFVDPPYEKGLALALLVDDLAIREILAKDAIVVVETRKSEILPETAGPLRLIKSRTYGDTRVHVFKREGDR